MRGRTITKEGVEKLLKIKGLLLRTLHELENLKVVDVGSDWAMISLAFYPCYKEVTNFVRFIDDYLSDNNSN